MEPGTDPPPDDFTAEQDAARQIVTACLAGDAALAGALARSFAHGDLAAALRLSLAAADLTAMVHRWWAHSVFPSWGPENITDAWTQVLRLEEEGQSGGR